MLPVKKECVSDCVLLSERHLSVPMVCPWRIYVYTDPLVSQVVHCQHFGRFNFGNYLAHKHK